MSSPVWHPFTQHGLNEDIPLIARAEDGDSTKVQFRSAG